MIADWASKYIGTILRIAGLLHLAGEDSGTEISAHTMCNAIQIGKYFLAHSVYAYSMMGGNDIEIQKAGYILSKLKKQVTSPVKRNKLYQSCRGRYFKTVDEFIPVLDILSARGYVCLETPEYSGAGRPPDVLVHLNPAA